MGARIEIWNTCEECHESYRVRPSKAKSRFCSVGCRQASVAVEYRDLTCEQCGTGFNAKQDHGEWPRFCERVCFLAACVRPEHKPCENCRSMFLARKSSTSNELKRFCSNKCAGEAVRCSVEKQCAHCLKPFSLTPSVARQRPDESCCSDQCRVAYYVGERNKTWKGGGYHSESAGHKFVKLVRPGKVGNYVGNHRVVAGNAVGRILERQECVIRINNDKTDDRPENLFICGSNSEFSKRRNGSLPWPTSSNLDSYR